MKLPIRWRMTAVFSALFAVVLMLTGVLVYTTVRREMEETLRNSLANTSDLIKRIVEVSIDNNQGQIAKNLTLAELMIEGAVTVDQSKRHTFDIFNEVREEHGFIELPELRINGDVVSGRNSLVDRIQRKTGGVVAVYQMSDSGFVSVASTIRQAPWRRGVGSTIPRGSPVYELVMRESPFLSRDYFNRDWYLTAHKLIRTGDGEVAGALYVAIKQVNMAALEEDVLSITVGDTGTPYIVDIVGNMVVHPTLRGQNLRGLSYIRKIAQRTNGEISYIGTAGRDRRTERYIATFKSIPAMNWIVVAGSAEREFYGNLEVLNSALLLIYFLATIATFLLSVLVAGRITEPLGQIREKIKEISEGEADLEKHLDVPSEDEVGELARYFNTFMQKLRNLSDVEHREVELQLRDAQMSALQAQINPHFLYNTLETIRFMIAMKDRRSQEMVQHLADLLRISIGKGERYVRIRDELEHIKLYIAIQEMRYPERFTVRYAVDETLFNFYTIKFLLQPVVENAIHHGFEAVERGGFIEISGRLQAEKLVLQVRDNGCGMSRAQTERLRGQLRGQSEEGSIGLPNVCARIRLHFGDEFGLYIDSQSRKGTTVTFELPILSQEPRAVFAKVGTKRKLFPLSVS
jgi:sensor histidine kinase YesM